MSDYIGSGPEGQRHAVAGGHLRVGGELEELPRPAGGQYEVAAAELLRAAGERIEGFQAADATVFHDDMRGQAVFQNGDLRHPYLAAEGGLYLGAGGVASGVQDARHAVGRLAGEGDLPVEGVEGDAEFDQVGDAVGGFLGKDAHGFFVAQPGAGGDGVLEVQLGGIHHADGGGDASLGVARVAVFDAALGDQQDAAVLPGQQRRVEAGDAAADYDIVVVFNGVLLSNSESYLEDSACF